MIKPLLDFARRHIILFGTAKFAAGLVIGFALGVYFLPILTEEKGLDTAALAQLEASAERSGTFTRDLPGSDAFHWGEGTVQRYAYLAGGQNLAGTRLPAVSDTLTRHRRGILPEDQGPVCTGRRGQGLQQFQPRCAARHHGWRLSGGADMVRGIRRVHYRGRAELRRAAPLI